MLGLHYCSYMRSAWRKTDQSCASKLRQQLLDAFLTFVAMLKRYLPVHQLIAVNDCAFLQAERKGSIKAMREHGTTQGTFLECFIIWKRLDFVLIAHKAIASLSLCGLPFCMIHLTGKEFDA